MEAMIEDLCSLRITEYGDMRSFIIPASEARSYGASVDLVEYFNCISSGTIKNQSRNYQNLTIRATFDANHFKTLLGKGILLKNINRDLNLAFGIFTSPDDFIKLQNT